MINRRILLIAFFLVINSNHLLAAEQGYLVFEIAPDFTVTNSDDSTDYQFGIEVVQQYLENNGVTVKVVSDLSSVTVDAHTYPIVGGGMKNLHPPRKVIATPYSGTKLYGDHHNQRHKNIDRFVFVTPVKQVSAVVNYISTLDFSTYETVYKTRYRNMPESQIQNAGDPLRVDISPGESKVFQVTSNYLDNQDAKYAFPQFLMPDGSVISLCVHTTHSGDKADEGTVTLCRDSSYGEHGESVMTVKSDLLTGVKGNLGRNDGVHLNGEGNVASDYPQYTADMNIEGSAGNPIDIGKFIMEITE